MNDVQTRALRLLCNDLLEEEAQTVVAYWLAYTDRNATLLEEEAQDISQAQAEAIVNP